MHLNCFKGMKNSLMRANKEQKKGVKRPINLAFILAWCRK